MSFTFQELPRDDNGIIIGMWRVMHKTPSFEGGMGGAEPVNFVKGVADRPLGGGALHHLMSAMGNDVTCQPWGDEEVSKPTPDNTRRVRGVGPTDPDTMMSREERESLEVDKRREAGAAAVADGEKRAQFSGLVPQIPPAAHAEIARLRESETTEPDDNLPQITQAAAPVAEPAKAAPVSDVAPKMDENQRAVLDMLEDAGDAIEQLRELAEEVGIKVDRRWRSERLRIEIKAAAEKAEATETPDDGLDDVDDMDVLRSLAEGLGIEADEFDSASTLRIEIRRARADDAEV